MPLHAAIKGVTVQAQAEILGKVKGQSVAMLVHHSRNSEQKQWDETLVLALSGIGRLLRLHLLLIASMEAFPQVGLPAQTAFLMAALHGQVLWQTA